MPVRAGRSAWVGVVASMLIASALLAIPLALSGGPLPTRAGFALAAGGPCPGAPLPSQYNGTTRIANATFVAMMPINYSFMAQVATSINGGPPVAYACVAENATLYPTLNGTFSFSVPSNSTPVCSPVVQGVQYCNTTTGPYVALDLSPSIPYPTGLEPVVARNGTSFSILFVRDLTSITLAPAGPIRVPSVGAVVPFRATPLSALGSPSPASPTFDWSLTGGGWSFSGSPGAVANLTAASGAGPANLSVRASLATASGWAVTAPVNLTLIAVATAITGGGLGSTVIDAGQNLTFNVTGTGAPGYRYAATLTPGLGLPPIPVACSSTNATSALATIGCGGRYDYNGAGNAAPSLTLSNGVSSASRALGNVTVDAAPAVEFLPASPAGYVGGTIAVDVAARAGAAPYVRACLDDGGGSLACEASPGPVWIFNATFDGPGLYPARAWVVDAVGTNASGVTEVRIADPLAVQFGSIPTNLSGGSAVSLGASVAGGLLPARAWWNVSGSATPFAVQSVTGDGPITVEFVPAEAVGTVTLSLTVVDALGSRADVSVQAAVSAGPATAITADSTVPSAATAAGVPIPLSWAARDLAGEIVPSYASIAELSLTIAGSGAAVPGWVNASNGTPLASPLPGWFEVPASAWSGGSLNLSVAAGRAGSVEVGLSIPAGRILAPGPVALAIGPDVVHLRLFDPMDATAGPRSGSVLWQVTDRFGDPAPGADLTLTESFGALSRTVALPVVLSPNGTSEAWVNYSAPGSGAGTITVTDAAGDLLLAPISIGPAPGGPFGSLGLVVVLPALAAAAAVAGSTRPRRSRIDPTGPGETGDTGDDDEALRRLAEGRAATVEIVRRSGPIDLDGLAARWGDAGAPPELPDWVASLLTDGTLGATFGDDGVARFCLGPERPDAPRVTVDVAEFDRAEARRDAALADDGP